MKQETLERLFYWVARLVDVDHRYAKAEIVKLDEDKTAIYFTVKLQKITRLPGTKHNP